jgi:hypothetical protein
MRGPACAFLHRYQKERTASKASFETDSDHVREISNKIDMIFLKADRKIESQMTKISGTLRIDDATKSWHKREIVSQD